MGVPLPIAGVQSDFRSGNWGSNVRAHEPPKSSTVETGLARLRLHNLLPLRETQQAASLRDLSTLAFQLYPRTLKNSSADLPGSRNKSDITATASAPASMTERPLARVMPPIATSGLRVSSLARRTPSSPTTGSGLALLVVAKMGPMAR